MPSVSHRARVLLAVALVAVGLVWIGQGTGLVRGSSFMVDDPRWAAAGVIATLIGLVVGWSALSARRS
jgi:hypothetical protein